MKYTAGVTCKIQTFWNAILKRRTQSLFNSKHPQCLKNIAETRAQAVSKYTRYTIRFFRNLPQAVPEANSISIFHRNDHQLCKNVAPLTGCRWNRITPFRTTINHNHHAISYTINQFKLKQTRSEDHVHAEKAIELDLPRVVMAN